MLWVQWCMYSKLSSFLHEIPAFHSTHMYIRIHTDADHGVSSQLEWVMCACGVPEHGHAASGICKLLHNRLWRKFLRRVLWITRDCLPSELLLHVRYKLLFLWPRRFALPMPRWAFLRLLFRVNMYKCYALSKHFPFVCLKTNCVLHICPVMSMSVTSYDCDWAYFRRPCRVLDAHCAAHWRQRVAQ
jgi:hypothetical protein